MRSRKGITLEGKKQLIIEQKNLCAGCLEPLNSNLSKICVDHDHKTKQVRKLLCNPCNLSLGLMQENPNKIKLLARYAEYCQSLKHYEN